MPLINKETLASHRPIGRNTRDEQINPSIRDAEHIDVKPLLGDPFYNAIETDAASFPELMQPHSYQYNNETFTHQGLEKVISLFAYARHVLHGSFIDTGHGLVQKKNQDSEPVSVEQKKNTFVKDRQAAMAYFNEIALFLNRNSSSYPLWKAKHVGKSPRLRISKISK